jgi:hypothetical protein
MTMTSTTVGTRIASTTAGTTMAATVITGHINHRYDKHGRGIPKAGLYLYFACLYNYYEIIGIVYIKRKRFYYLIKPFALDGGPGLLSSSFASKGYRLKSGQNL